MKSQTIQSPEGVRLLMENIWLRHKAGLGQKPDNVLFVELPPPTPEEIEEARSQRESEDKNQ